MAPSVLPLLPLLPVRGGRRQGGQGGQGSQGAPRLIGDDVPDAPISRLTLRGTRMGLDSLAWPAQAAG